MTETTIAVWVWLPGASAPVQAAMLDPGRQTWEYVPTYFGEAAIAPDPVVLPITGRTGARSAISLARFGGLPGVVRDAMPSGYGADRLDAQAGRKLTELELLHFGAPDSVGAIEATSDIERKLAWKPHGLEQLKDALRGLDESEPSSRAIRRLNEDGSTSAGGERPKITIQHEGKLWLAKMRDRGDVPFLPAKEFVTMRLAQTCGITVPRTELITVGSHQVFLIERFDRAGDPEHPTRRFFASAHTVLGLGADSVRGDPARSYLVFADRMRRWCTTGADAHVQELWRRMAFNGLVGNTDDHARNHGMLHGDDGWGLAPAFDVTPAQRVPAEFVSLAMATGADGSCRADETRLLEACGHFRVDPEWGARWLLAASETVARGWRPCMRDSGVPDAEIDRVAPAFALATSLAEAPDRIQAALERLQAQGRRRVRSGRARMR